MSRSLLLLALWAASPTPGQVGSAALYTEFQKRPAPEVEQAIREVVDALMAPNGLRFEWKSLPAEDHSVWIELAVVKFSGRCEVLPLATAPNADSRLGWTHISDGIILPYAEVDCDAILAYVVKELVGRPIASRNRVYGRAIGRVLAHELLHIFAHTTAHGSHGVDQPTLTISELLADRLPFDEHAPEMHMVRAGKAAAPPTLPGLAKKGQATYLTSGCATCHGGQGEGTKQGPVLRIAGRFLNSVMLAAKLTKSERKMCQRAHSMKIAPPSIAEEELNNVVSFLNERDQ